MSAVIDFAREQV